MSAGTPEGLSADQRRVVIDLLNDAMSYEYHSFVGYALNSNPYVTRQTEADLKLLEGIRDDENANCRALLVQLGRYRAGPTLRAFEYWTEDLNFLALDWLVERAAKEMAGEVERVEGYFDRLPDDAQLRATFKSLLASKQRHLAELEPLAAKRKQEREARRAAAVSITAVKMKAPRAAAPKRAAAPGAPKPPGAPRPPGAPKPPGAPRPPGPPLPPGAPRPPGPPKPPGPPLPPGAPKPPSGPPKPPGPPLPPGAPKPPSGPPKPPGPPLPPGAPKPPSGPPKPPGPGKPPSGPPKPPA